MIEALEIQTSYNFCKAAKTAQLASLCGLNGYLDMSNSFTSKDILPQNVSTRSKDVLVCNYFMIKLIVVYILNKNYKRNCHFGRVR